MSQLKDRIRRFARLQTLAKADVRRAGLALRGARHHLDQEAARLRELVGYAGSPPANAEPAVHRVNRERFAAKLRLAMNQQQRVVSHAASSLSEARAAWFGARRNTERFDAALRELEKGQQAEDARRLMRELDEHAARQFARRRAQERSHN
ncbi:MAG: flagellar FliJ family protein [Pseudomonadota bacterium]